MTSYDPSGEATSLTMRNCVMRGTIEHTDQYIAAFLLLAGTQADRVDVIFQLRNVVIMAISVFEGTRPVLDDITNRMIYECPDAI